MTEAHLALVLVLVGVLGVAALRPLATAVVQGMDRQATFLALGLLLDSRSPVDPDAIRHRFLAGIRDSTTDLTSALATSTIGTSSD